MSKKRIIASLFFVAIIVLMNVWILKCDFSEEGYVNINITINSDKENAFALYYIENGGTIDDGFSEEKCGIYDYKKVNKNQVVSYSIPSNSDYLRLDFGTGNSLTVISKFEVEFRGYSKEISIEQLSNIVDLQETIPRTIDGNLQVESILDDPFVIWSVADWNIQEVVNEAFATKNLVIKLIACLCVDLIALVILRRAKSFAQIPVELIQNRKLIANLAKNDFKTKFAGSYLGIIWAFVQPIVTVLVYWFVFEKGLRASGINTREGIYVPYVLWMIAGLVPWFFFQDALNGATNALIEYSYLVKKVVFKISILPIIKVISALFVHLFFIVFMLILYSAYGYYPDAYVLQIIYYSLCMFVFVLGISYMSCAIVVFFRDLTQIINIILQVGIWVTPIMWNIDGMELSPALLAIFKANPMYYIVAGYREALIDKVWFWQNPKLMLYFWIVTIFMFGIGSLVFKRLKVHFADVL